MRALPLYPAGPPVYPVEDARTPRSPDPGVVYVLTGDGSPTSATRCLDAGTPAGAFVRGVVAGLGRPLRVIYDGVAGDGAAALAATRTRLAQELWEERPERVVVLGDLAAQVVLGDGLPGQLTWDARGGYAHLSTLRCPALLLPAPTRLVLENRFARADLEAGLRWALTCPPPPPGPWGGRALVVETAGDAREACRVLGAAPWVAWDTETCARRYDRAFRLLRVGACAAGADDAYVWPEAALMNPAVRAPLAALLCDPDVEKAAQNGMYDVVSIHAAWGAWPRGCVRDTQLRRAVLDPEVLTRLETQQALVGMHGGKAEMEGALGAADARVRAELARRTGATADLYGAGPDLPAGVDLGHVRSNVRGYAYALVPPDLLTRYNALDVVSTARLEARHAGALARPANADLARAWAGVVAPSIDGVAQVTAWGVRVDKEACRALAAYLVMDAARHLAAMAPYNFTEPGSHPKVASLLYDTLKLPVLATTPGGAPSTAGEVLEQLAGHHPVVSAIVAWRTADKLRGTYAEGLAAQVCDDGRIHVDFRIDGARSGRLSAGGGLHGLPRAETPEGKMVRDCLVPSPGMVFLELDLSQAELRVLAGLSGDVVMGDVFRAGVDIHLRTAQLIAKQMWNLAPEQLLPRHRSVAKIINLALAYGKGDAALAAEMGTTKEAARATRQAIMGAFGRATAWMDEELAWCRRTGYARVYLDGEPCLRRPFWEIAAPGEHEHARGLRGHAERACRNHPVQGTTGYLVLRALNDTVAWIRATGARARVVLTVHDSLLLEVHPDDLARVTGAVRAIMEGTGCGAVPLVADVKTGPSAGSLVKARAT